MFSLKLPHQGNSNKCPQYMTQCTIFNIQEENHPKLSQIWDYGFLYKETQEQV